MPATLLVPVTAQLKTDLNDLGILLSSFDISTSNDLEHFQTLVGVLESSVKSVFKATSDSWLTADISRGARFNMGPDTTLAGVIADSISYLRGPAATALSGVLSGATHVLCDQVWSRLQALFQAALDAIARVAAVDLGSVHGQSAVKLIDAATLLAQASHV